LKKNLANLNNNNFRYLQFDGTFSKDYLKDSNLNEDNKKYYNSDVIGYTQYLPQTKASFKNFEVNVFMPSTEMNGKEGYLQRYPYRTFEVTPSSGQVVTAMDFKVDMGAKIPIPCIQIYHHLYNLDYDLIVKLQDKNEDGENYFFQFPLRVKIEDNTPKNTPNFITSNQVVSTFNNANYCSNDSKEYPLEVYVKDSNTGDYLADVNISYDCISLSCDLGVVELPTFNGVIRKYATPSLKTEFPYCIGGDIVANKKGYHESKLRVDTTSELLDKDVTPYYELELIPTKEFENSKSIFMAVNKDTKQGVRVYNEDEGYFYASIENKELNFDSFGIWPHEGYLNKIKLLERDDISYNISIAYVDSDYNLKGIYQLENYVLNPNLGDEIEFVIPSVSEELNEDNFMDFYDYTNEIQSYDSNLNPYGIKFK